MGNFTSAFFFFATVRYENIRRVWQSDKVFIIDSKVFLIANKQVIYRVSQEECARLRECSLC